MFTLHFGDREFRIASARVDESAEAAAIKWGGQWVPQPGGMLKSSTDRDALGVCGTLRFGPELFREMDHVDRGLAGSMPGDVVYTKGGLALLANRDETIELTMRRHHLATAVA